MSVTGKRVLVFIAHPDDEIQAAGTLAKLSRSGNDVYLCIATDGDKGTHDINVKPHEIKAIRREEMAAVAKILGFKELIWLGFSDGTLENRRPEVKEAVFRTIRQVKPDIVMSFDGWARWDPHSDHRTIGQVATEAAYLADGLWYYPEHTTQGLAAHRTPETYLFATEEPNHVVDITETYELKVKAAQVYVSQWGANLDYDQRLVARLKAQGRPESDKYKETFRRIRDEGLAI
jgi:LmbE family N-acetylglucosaminyl deacetylase